MSNKQSTKKPRGRPRLPANRTPDLRQLHLDRRAAQIAAVEQLVADEPITDDDLLTQSEVAEWLSVSKEWLEAGRSKGYGPPYHKVTNNMIRYRRAESM